MSDAYVEKIAGELAELAMADERRTDDEKIVNEIAEIVGASSQTLQEAYLTAVRVRRAEKRARALLADRASEMIVKTQRLLTDETGDGGEAVRQAKREAEAEEEALQNLIASVGDDDDDDGPTDAAPDVIVPPSPGVSPSKPNRS